MASLSQGRTAAAQCGLFTYQSVPVIFEPPCMIFRTKNYSFFEEVSYSKNNTLARNFYQCILFSGLSSNIDKSYLLTFQWAEY